MYVDIRTNPKQRAEDVLREFKEVVHGALTGSQFGTYVEIVPYAIVPSVAARGDEPVFKAIELAHHAVFGRTQDRNFADRWPIPYISTPPVSLPSLTDLGPEETSMRPIRPPANGASRS